MIQFLLNQELIGLTDCDPNMTVLNYLRQLKSRTGTKEGCASGDCGACSVVLVELKDGQLHYSTINSCLTLVSALDGKQLITVEDLKSQDSLHLVQQAMVESHGSQCGFCTPGIVMSLFAHRKHTDVYDREAVMSALSGNLCRCTGYQPILNAAKSLYSVECEDKFTQQTAVTVEQLKRLQNNPTKGLSFQDTSSCQYESYVPDSLDELDQLLNNKPRSKLIAGGTDLTLAITQMQQRFDTLIHLHKIPDLNGIRFDEHRIEIGAATPINQCQNVIALEYPDLAHLFERFASLQIRNQATLGGNIANASPIGDAPPALIAAGASVLLRKEGLYRIISLDKFFVDYKKTELQTGEYIVKIIIPHRPASSIYKVYKVSKRLDDDISAVCAAIYVDLNQQSQVSDIKIAFGGMAATPKRAAKTEQALLHKPWDETSVEQAIQALKLDFTPLSDLRASSEYRMLVAANLLRKCLIETQNTHAMTRVTDYV